jgi:hypothetical protein
MNANGRVNILEESSQNVFSLYDKIPIDQKMSSYNDALTGNFEKSNLSRAFFSAKNIIIIQNSLMANVHKASNGHFNIGYQNEDTLKIIMRSVFLQHSANLCTNITEQIVELNKIVSEYCVPKLCSEASAYIKYKNDISILAVPLNRPISTYNNNTLELKNFL